MGLNWGKVNWDCFQDLTVHVAESIFPDCNFQPYLKKGQKQEGHDLKTFSKKDSSFICVECKHYKKITVTELQVIVNKFLEGTYGKQSSCFVISTTADLQKVDLQNKIGDLQIELNKNNIQFECWDKTAVETILKNYWSIVAYYFGEYEADEHCLPQISLNNLPSLEPMPNYIPRLVSAYSVFSSENLQ